MLKTNLYNRITLTALMTAFYIIATRVTQVPVTSLVRLSAGPAVLIFASLLLGPIPGAIVGGAGDFIGAIAVPYMGMAINPFMTISYIFMGMIPGLIYRILKKINNEKLLFIIFSFLVFLIWIVILIFSFISREVQIFNHIYELTPITKIVVLVVSLLLSIITILFVFGLNWYFKRKYTTSEDMPSIYLIAFIVLFINMFFTLIINSIIKSLYYELPIDIVMFTSSLVAFIYIPCNTLIVSYLCLIIKKINK